MAADGWRSQGRPTSMGWRGARLEKRNRGIWGEQAGGCWETVRWPELKLISKHKGVLHKVLLQVRQAYERFEASSIIDTDDARLEYFSKKEHRLKVPKGFNLEWTCLFSYPLSSHFLMLGDFPCFCPFGSHDWLLGSAAICSIPRLSAWFRGIPSWFP
ncbi:hypothetical protein MA16_Dca012142 [Dendrobium catenatum]|uniref:Uncharacterized protein n=1 Tax=Dendrobium catenatum TaxID=906689 RepID=A0A2I0VF83_9ASPA|nr:hypothetical protein MA16_Dca012142 [Dendrobium catenatum]